MTFAAHQGAGSAGTGAGPLLHCEAGRGGCRRPAAAPVRADLVDAGGVFGADPQLEDRRAGRRRRGGLGHHVAVGLRHGEADRGVGHRAPAAGLASARLQDGDDVRFTGIWLCRGLGGSMFAPPPTGPQIRWALVSAQLAMRIFTPVRNPVRPRIALAASP